MALENVTKFEKLLREDEALQAKLKAAAEALKGDAGDEAATFDATIGALAAEVGLPFTLEEARSFASDGGELDDGELEAVAGGGRAYCFVIGGGDTKDATCDVVEGHACAYVGIGIINFDK